MAICKSGGPKGCSDRWDTVIGWIGAISHQVWSLLGVVELTILCAFVSKVGYFDAQSRQVQLTCLSKNNVTNYLQGVKLWNNLHFFTHFLFSVFEKYCTNFKPLFLAESTYLSPFSIYLPWTRVFLVIILGATPKHISIKYRCPSKISNQLCTST